jgi:hypothetical protein
VARPVLLVATCCRCCDGRIRSLSEQGWAADGRGSSRTSRCGGEILALPAIIEVGEKGHVNILPWPIGSVWLSSFP